MVQSTLIGTGTSSSLSSKARTSMLEKSEQTMRLSAGTITTKFVAPGSSSILIKHIHTCRWVSVRLAESIQYYGNIVTFTLSHFNDFIIALHNRTLSQSKKNCMHNAVKITHSNPSSCQLKTNGNHRNPLRERYKIGKCKSNTNQTLNRRNSNINE